MTKTDGYVYSIRQVIDLTGVSEFTLRGWESRYQAFTPHRSKTGRRLYSKVDLTKIRLLVDLLAQGHRIGNIAHQSPKQLEDLALFSQAHLSASAAEGKKTSNPADIHVKKILALAKSFHFDKIQNQLGQIELSLGPQEFILNFLLKLIGEMNSLVQRRQFSISQEHIMSALLKGVLHKIISVSNGKFKPKVRVVLAAPEGDFHEIGLLIASALLSLQGYRQLYLGPNVPKADLCEAGLRFKATHVLLATTISAGAGAKDDLYKYIHFLDRNLDPNIALIIGGRNVKSHSMQLAREYHSLSTFSHLTTSLKPK